MGPHEWQAHGLCQQVGSEVFFPVEDAGRGGGTSAMYASARKVCASCPVEQECRLAGVGEVAGVWGGMSPKQRRQLRADAVVTVGKAWGAAVSDFDGSIDQLRAKITRIWKRTGSVLGVLEEIPELDKPEMHVVKAVSDGDAA